MPTVDAKVRVTVYVKSQCRLCGPMLELVERVHGELGFELDVVDVTDRPELRARYGQEVPVLEVDGHKLAAGVVTEKALRRSLRKAGAVEVSGSDAKHEVVQALPARADFVPPRAVILALSLLAAVGFSWFVSQGLADARVGRGRLAEKLLGVEPRSELPRGFELPAMKGGEIRLDQLRDKVVFINFWATWCPPCVEEMPSLRRLEERLSKDPRFVMLAVSADEDWPVVRQFFSREPPRFQVLLDKQGAIAKQYGTEKFPETYVVVNGELVGYIIGPRDWDTWYAEEYLRSLLAHGKLRS
jgi:thiol-disulfide isomerase/thioredoxin/glutaredoxin